MTQIPQGWYPDPAPGQPGQPAMLRYWDGNVWTEHTAPAVGQQPVAPTPAYVGVPAAPAYAPTGPTTPDGVPLAGWWWRVLAYIIDGFAVGIVSQIATIPASISMQSDFNDVAERNEGRLENAETWDQIKPFFDDMFEVFRDHMLWLFLPGMILTFVYMVGMWRWKGATLGQLAVGLRVRHPDHVEATLPFGRALARWFVLSGLASLVSLAALQGSLATFVAVSAATSLFGLINVLWPLWDKRRQALHDKVAKTVVVKIR